MSIDRHRALIDDICTQTDIGDPRSMYEAAHIGIDGTNFTLTHGGAMTPDATLMYADLGGLPSIRREAVLLRLLELNLALSGGGANPAFVFNPETRHAMLTARFPLATASAAFVLDALTVFSRIAHAWRKDYLLDDTLPKPGQGVSRQVTSLYKFRDCQGK